MVMRQGALQRRSVASVVAAVIVGSLLFAQPASAWTTGWFTYRAPFDPGIGILECGQARVLTVTSNTIVKAENEAFYQWSNPCPSRLHPLPRPEAWLRARAFAYSGFAQCSAGANAYNMEGANYSWGYSSTCPGMTLTGGVAYTDYYHPNLGGYYLGGIKCALPGTPMPPIWNGNMAATTCF